MYQPATTTVATGLTTAPPRTTAQTTVALTSSGEALKVAAIYAKFYEIENNGIIQLMIKPEDRDGSIVLVQGPFDIRVWTTKNSGQSSQSSGIIQQWDNIVVDISNYDPYEGVNLSLLYTNGFLDSYDDPGYIEVTLKVPGGVDVSTQVPFDNLQPVL